MHTMVTSFEKVILDAKKNFVETVKSNHGLGAGFAVWWILTAAVMLVSLGLTLNISPVAAGSGIPQMKTQLTGATIKGYLSFRTLVAKICGLVCSVGAGMYIGQEGPFVHIASALANSASAEQALLWAPASSGCDPMARTTAAMPPAAAIAAMFASAPAISASA